MNTRVRPSRTLRQNAFAGDPPEAFGKGSLHRGESGLNLPAAEVGPVVGQGDLQVTTHVVVLAVEVPARILVKQCKAGNSPHRQRCSVSYTKPLLQLTRLKSNIADAWRRVECEPSDARFRIRDRRQESTRGH